MEHRLLFSDFFNVEPNALEDYGAFNVSLVADLPLFIDPFLLFNSTNPEYQRLHSDIIKYMQFLYSMSLSQRVDEGLLRSWYYFQEVKQTWLGFSSVGNKGSGLGKKFATALNLNFPRVFDPASNRITKGRHLEKLCLIADRVGRDNISDFTTNLIKEYLLEFTQDFARKYIDPQYCDTFAVRRARFNYTTHSWETLSYHLPMHQGDYVLLVPSDILTRDETWINRDDLVDDFHTLPPAIPDQALRAQINHYFQMALPSKPNEKETREAIQKTLRQFPVLLDYYIRRKEDRGDRAHSVSTDKVERARHLFLEKFTRLVSLLSEHTPFYDFSGSSYTEALARVKYLKQVIENNDGYRMFYDSKGRPIQREEDLHVAYKLTWFAAQHDVNQEVDNGRGPVDFKVSAGSADKSLVEFKLASNSHLKKNLENQVEIYKAANETSRAIKVIMCFTAAEKAKVERCLRELKIEHSPDVVVIDARRDNKQSASKVR